MANKVEIPLCGVKYNQHDKSALAFSYHKHEELMYNSEDPEASYWIPEGQMYYEPLEDVYINSETPRLTQFEARSLGRLAVGFFNTTQQHGELDLQDAPANYQI